MFNHLYRFTDEEWAKAWARAAQSDKEKKPRGQRFHDKARRFPVMYHAMGAIAEHMACLICDGYNSRAFLYRKRPWGEADFRLRTGSAVEVKSTERRWQTVHDRTINPPGPWLNFRNSIAIPDTGLIMLVQVDLPPAMLARIAGWVEVDDFRKRCYENPGHDPDTAAQCLHWTELRRGAPLGVGKNACPEDRHEEMILKPVIRPSVYLKCPHGGMK